MVLVVTGTRRGRDDVHYWLDRFLVRHGRPRLVVLGDARGVDAEARAWATRHDLVCAVYVARWAELGRAAGHLRNQAMVEQAGSDDWCLAFPAYDVPSPGTWDCVRRARAREIQTIVLPLALARQ